eukprot:73645_1
MDFRTTLWMLITVLIAIYGVNKQVTAPYMDEIFHIPQTQTFCEGKWTQYHPKITTFPGLYIIPALISQLFQLMMPSALTVISSCSILYLRTFNIIYMMLCIPIIREIIWSLHGDTIIAKLIMIAKKKTDVLNTNTSDKTEPQISLKEHNFDDIIDTIKTHFTMEIVLFPLNYFYVFMFYTDIPSTFWLLTAYLCYLKLFQTPNTSHDTTKQFYAFFIGFIAILHRQTNVIWIGFYFLLSIYDLFVFHSFPLVDRTQSSKIKFNLIKFITWCWQRKFHIIRVLWYYELLFIAFVSFVLWNGSVVLGDKSHHQYSLHLAQMLYLIGLLLVFTQAPNAIKCAYDTMTNRHVHFGKAKKFMKAHALVVIVLLVLFAVFRYKFTVVHDFLLSDNRHYSFYIWRYFLSKTWFTLIIVPVTTLGVIYLYYEAMSVGVISQYWCIAFVICCFMVLSPTPLFEMRYFIIPIIIFKLNYLCNHALLDVVVSDSVMDALETVCNQRSGSMTLPLLDFLFNRVPTANIYKWINLIMYVAIDIVTLYVYIAKPFAWVDGTTARFMW